MARLREDVSEITHHHHHLGLLKLLKVLSFLLLFAAGIILGLLASSHVNTLFNSQRDLFYPSNIDVTTSILTDGNSSSNCNTSSLHLKPCNCKSCVDDDVDCLNMDSFLHPKHLTHGMNDEEIFWRASLVPTKRDYPFDRLPKVAFMFLTRGPMPLLLLWERFFKGHQNYFTLYLHTDPGYVLNVSTDSPFYGRQIPSQQVEWGTVSLLDAERRLLANALLEFSNERFILLSESCIPVYNFPTVYNYLIHSEQSFVESYDDPSRYGRGRYSRKMLPNIWVRQWRKGSQWFEMQRDLAAYIVSDTKYYTLFKKHCTPACYPDEHFLPTFIHMFHGSMSANRTLTWVDWSLGGPHPATYGAVNITESFIQSIRMNKTVCSYNAGTTPICHLFARKFDASALEPLLNLTSRVMEF
ncbi:Glycosyltransferase BC10 [Linum perenne]